MLIVLLKVLVVHEVYAGAAVCIFFEALFACEV
jgi:hypothetical protein